MTMMSSAAPAPRRAARSRSPTIRPMCSSSTTTRAFARCLSSYLSREGYRVTTAASAEAARAKLASIAFDALILDVMMPGESGFDLARDLKKASDTPILMLTARTETEDRVMGLEIGADDYLAKPFDPRELLLRLVNVLRRSAGERAGRRGCARSRFASAPSASISSAANCTATASSCASPIASARC